MSDDGQGHKPEAGGLNAIMDVMAQLQQLMQTEYSKLRDNMGDFSKEKEFYDMLKHKITSTMPREDERLKLNVSGSRFEIRESIAIKNFFFRTLLSGSFSARDSDGYFYIDRDPTHVHVILNYLRDGAVELGEYNHKQLNRLRMEAEFYMVPELSSRIDEALSGGSEHSPLTVVRFARPVAAAVNGIFFEIIVKKSCKLHAVGFVAGERRKIPAQLLLRSGRLRDVGASQMDRIAELHSVADKGEVVSFNFSARPLAAGTYTIGIYSVSPSAVGVSTKERTAASDGFVEIGHTYHTTNTKGDWVARAGEDQYDFSGELSLSE